MLRIAASAEKYSNHPTAKALAQLAGEAGVPLAEPKDFAETAGRGVKAEVDGAKVLVGRAQWLRDNGVQEDFLKSVDLNETEGWSLIFVARDGRCIGWVGLQDQTRAEARESLVELKASGVRRIAMVSGDRQPVATRVAREIGCEEAKGECLPQNKVEFVRAVKEQYVNEELQKKKKKKTARLLDHAAHVSWAAPPCAVLARGRAVAENVVLRRAHQLRDVVRGLGTAVVDAKLRRVVLLPQQRRIEVDRHTLDAGTRVEKRVQYLVRLRVVVSPTAYRTGRHGRGVHVDPRVEHLPVEPAEPPKLFGRVRRITETRRVGQEAEPGPGTGCCFFEIVFFIIRLAPVVASRWGP